MNNSNRFIEISVKQQLALCNIAHDLNEIDTEINKSFSRSREKAASNSGFKLTNLITKILSLIS